MHFSLSSWAGAYLLRDEWIRTLIPMQRAGLPHEIAKVVAFVSSDGASYMTGSTLDVNGGMAMY
jgi:3-oxoacyl-[acyl-carrier protein] reductase